MVERREERPPVTTDIVNNWDEKVATFEELDLKKNLLRGIYGMGFEKPSIIQQKGIIPMIRNRDTIAQAQSGTGKTGTFSISTLQLIDENSATTQGLILAPTRELAKQIYTVILCLGQYMEVKVHICTGGTDLKQDRQKLREGVQIVVGTPGRVYELIDKDILNTDNMKVCVLDEADEMLKRDFRDQISDIFQKLPRDIQMGLFSATMPPEMLNLTKEIMRDPATILVKKEQLTLDGIKQFYIALQKEELKFQTLLQLYKHIEIVQCIIYTNSKERAMKLTQQLREQQFTVSTIFGGEMPMEEREAVMKQFRSGSAKVLVTTDLLARGIDVHQVSMVINYDLPKKKEQYIHRIGRSGRYGKKGVAINFVVPSDYKYLLETQKYYDTEIQKMPLDVSKIYD